MLFLYKLRARSRRNQAIELLKYLLIAFTRDKAPLDPPAEVIARVCVESTWAISPFLVPGRTLPNKIALAASAAALGMQAANDVQDEVVSSMFRSILGGLVEWLTTIDLSPIDKLLLQDARRRLDEVMGKAPPAYPHSFIDPS